MTREEFLQALVDNGISIDCVCFDDGFKDDVYCVWTYHGISEVFYRERGTVHGLTRFTSEPEALEYLLEKLKKIYS